MSSTRAAARTLTRRLRALGARAQTIEARGKRASGAPSSPWDAARTARLGGFGFCFYGPVMHYWYRALNAAFPTPAAAPLASKLAPFLTKVALNQLLLGPVVVSCVFAWTLGWTGRLAELPDKWRRDTLPTLRKGWSFWVPASSVNFALVPLRYQVLYMSACGVVWSSILSAASAKGAPEAAAPAGKKGAAPAKRT